MPRSASIAIAVALLTGIVACGRTPDAAPTDVVATAGTAQLSVGALAGLLAESRAPLRARDARAIVERWIDYQLIARAAASGDSLEDPALLDTATWAPVANARARKWYERVSRTWTLAVGDPKAMYDAGQILAVRQILLPVPQAAIPVQRAAIRQRVDSLRRSLTPTNFADVARKVSADASSARQGGLLPAWPAQRGVMLTEFETGALATRPGAISGLIGTPYGIHIVYRLTWPEAASSATEVARQLAVRHADSAYFARLEAAGAVRVVDEAPARVRAIVADLRRYADSTLVLATTRRGDFTAAKLVRWVNAYPPEQGMEAQLANAADTLVPKIVRDLVRNELFLQQADSAGVTLTPSEIAAFRTELRGFLVSAWGTLGVAPRMLPDSVRRMPAPAREQFAARRIEAFVTNMVTRQGLVVPVPNTLRELLRARYRDVTVSAGAIDAAVVRATPLRATRDSARRDSTRRDSTTAPGAPAPPSAPSAPPRA